MGALVQRLHREAVGHTPDTDLLAELLDHPGVPASWRTPLLDNPTVPVIPVVVEKDGIRLAYFSTVTTVGTAQDITLQEIRIESFFPLDQETAKQARRMGRA